MATRMFHREETRSGLRSALTWDGALQYKKTGVIPTYDGNLSDADIEIRGHAARADSTTGGLKMIETLDDTHRPIRTFQLAPGQTKRGTWMGQFMAEPQLQIRINKRADPPGSAEALAFETQWRETQRQITAGQYTLPEF
jgi:hypothetical protein